MKILRLIGLLAVLFTCCCSGVSLMSSTKAREITHLQDMTAALVEDSALEPGRLRVFCSGVWISERLIATAHHCVDNEDAFDLLGEPLPIVGRKIQYLTFRVSNGRPTEEDLRGPAEVGTVVAEDPAQDLAIIRVPVQHEPHATASFSPVAPLIGDSVDVVGHTAGLPWSYSPGTVGATRRMKNINDASSSLIQVVSGAWRGNSGGGVYNQQGELLGICSFMASGTQVSFFVQTGALSRLLGTIDT